jgi:hypothetical protein
MLPAPPFGDIAHPQGTSRSTAKAAFLDRGTDLDAKSVLFILLDFALPDDADRPSAIRQLVDDVAGD